jgi:hypothetical protein
MRTVLVAPLALEPPPLDGGGSTQGAGPFREGEEAVLAAGTFHPVAWQAQSTSATPGFSQELGERI